MVPLKKFVYTALVIVSILSVSMETIATGLGRCHEYPENYWLYSNDNGRSNNSSNLYIDNLYFANPQLGYPINVGEIGVKELTDIAFLPDGQLFGVTFTHLVKINLNTKTSEIIGDGIGEDYFQEERKINALASDDSGQLFAATRDGELLTIDAQTGLGTPIGLYGNDLGSSGDIEFLPNGRLVGSAKQLDVEDGTSDLLIEIDKTSGTAYIIGEIGFKEVFGLANAPKNALYGIADGNGEPKLININKKNGKGKLIGSLPDSEGLWGMAARFSCGN